MARHRRRGSSRVGRHGWVDRGQLRLAAVQTALRGKRAGPRSSQLKPPRQLWIVEPVTFGGAAMRWNCLVMAALALAPAAQAQDATSAAATAAAVAPVHVVTNPSWIKLPSADDLARFWPPTA